MTTRVVIVQPYVPAYRVAFFDGLRRCLAELDIECVIAAGVPQGAQAQRGDSVRPDWLLPISRRTVNIQGRTLTMSVRPTPWTEADAVILGLAGSSIPVYRAIVASKVRKFRLGLWGHVQPYVSAGNALDLWLELGQMQVADHVFAYTPGGARYAVGRGVDPRKITTVMNTVDTSGLSQELDGLNSIDIREFATQHDFDPKRTVCFMGGLDNSKRIDFLADFLDELWTMDPSVRLLVGGRGPEEYLLEPAYRRGQAIQLGFLEGRSKALALQSSRAVCMPGRIGLVAVDSLVAQRPIVTTDWPYHAPENEYLREGATRFSVAGSAAEYSQTVLEVIAQKDNNCGLDTVWNYPTLNDMIERFATGVVKMLE